MARLRRRVYLIDTNVISEARKKNKANRGVAAFFRSTAAQGETLYLSTVSLGELRRGVELIRYRGDKRQAALLEAWLQAVVDEYQDHILALDADAAQVWGRLRVPHPEHVLDKQIAAIALVNGLTVVTRNTEDFGGTGVSLLNPFTTVE
jgi:toxin FitB